MSNKFKPNDMIGNWLLLKEVERPIYYSEIKQNKGIA